MSVTKITAITCNGCSNYVVLPRHMADTPSNARLIARQHGYRKKGPKDFCPLCHARRSQEKGEEASKPKRRRSRQSQEGGP